MINIIINWDLLLTDETKPELELELELVLVMEVISDIGEKVSIQ